VIDIWIYKANDLKEIIGEICNIITVNVVTKPNDRLQMISTGSQVCGEGHGNGY